MWEKTKQSFTSDRFFPIQKSRFLGSLDQSLIFPRVSYHQALISHQIAKKKNWYRLKCFKSIKLLQLHHVHQMVQENERLHTSATRITSWIYIYLFIELNLPSIKYYIYIWQVQHSLSNVLQKEVTISPLIIRLLDYIIKEISAFRLIQRCWKFDSHQSVNIVFRRLSSPSP